ncbi:DNA methyltransferase [Dolichospermum circinale]|uniref:DNA methyltransferase n=1 Tax=Dolichospermum circinale TaxID=109265 RepID=UPI00232F4AC3|nr:DNA methyltransferase [Dolichospermum circinale]MDB9454043.1 DNA methyltransferase [Dolichospermum circinale CS-541/06]MDB9463220.1 DNA methyltransferase [Dolichospermum circinale CS-541/04]MDB9549023.1 DNA methyltransferase [Dolichospermum circinale CS-1031]
MKNLFGNLNLQTLKKNPDFKEDSVREVIILPILKALGYTEINIIRSKTLQHPFLKIGSKKRPINLVPDYVLKVENNFAWVLDAKAPNENIKEGDHIEQVYSYATHPEIRSNYFALCNGVEFSIFKTTATNIPILFFNLDEIEYHWEKLTQYLSPNSFQSGKNFNYETTIATAKPQVSFDYNTRPLLEEILVKKQSAKRHFGVHGYFTKQAWNVVAEYIKNFSQPGDLILDPFGGSGVTAIEALMNNRKAISTDINPMAVFIVNSLITPVDFDELSVAFAKVKTEYENKEPKTETDIQKALIKYPYPQGLQLPKGSDVETVEQLFSDKQLAQLGLLKSIIKKEKNVNIRNSLMLAFSSTVNKHNLTFHYTKSDGGGDSSVFRYYRYRIAPDPGEMQLMTIYETKFSKVVAAKKEMEYFINEKTISHAQILKGTATNLSFIPKESVDYIYTDPPYGKKIPYLDLSVMWNAWLDLEVTEADYQQEAIEGGEHQKTKDEYNQLIAESIKEMYRVLKFDRWLSFVFAHKDPEFWHLIIDTAESCGFEYIGAVPQKNGQTSFKKRQNPFTVLSGQLIINFRKVRSPKAIMKANLGMDIAEIVIQTIEGIIAKNDGATLEQINDELIIKGLELGFLDLLKKEYSDLTPILLGNFDYDEKTELFTLKKDAKFKSHIDVKLRIKYYLISYLRRMERENKNPNFDQIVLHLLPLLKNGTTPEDQTILSVLEDIGERMGENSWKLKKEGQLSLF